ncbi:hypothetical protein BC939DRAFT_454039 [Gamsiella multidivaricata]|uniref:uncharacterized protein n=1 Tax=Gamsiella multidivaricata TaxID=101098 RepID=UPI0022210583|nr:uncharacterized protein BC939DRAFT_454039 [Gamsiella multidivaricata]KAI7822408.1 hypothetical protein BC939DRAFT_454039 [Gamsiella multidivaricata]
MNRKRHALVVMVPTMLMMLSPMLPNMNPTDRPREVSVPRLREQCELRLKSWKSALPNKIFGFSHTKKNRNVFHLWCASTPNPTKASCLVSYYYAQTYMHQHYHHHHRVHGHFSGWVGVASSYVPMTQLPIVIPIPCATQEISSKSS